MSETAQPAARVSMFVDASPSHVFTAFVEPDWLTQFWLFKASGPLRVGQSVEWNFMVSGAKDTATATELDPEKLLRGSGQTAPFELNWSPLTVGQPSL
jgi:uncharacterized protein YndB with AHSA1/START domain